MALTATPSLAASVRGPRVSAVGDHLETLATLTVREAVALAKARKIGLTEVFDILSMTDYSVDDWLPTWKTAHGVTLDACEALGLAELPDVCAAAADVAACRALARLLGSDVGLDIHLRLAEPWRYASRAHRRLAA